LRAMILLLVAGLALRNSWSPASRSAAAS
jgi:hypothetical protein